MKRNDVLKEFLKVIFGSTTVRPTGGKIYKSGNLFSSCKYDEKDKEAYLKLIQIAYQDNNPKQQSPNFDPISFDRKQSIINLFNYLRSYKGNLSLPAVDAPSSSKFAFKAAVAILEGIFSPSSELDKFKIENEDISIEFRKALDQIQWTGHTVNFNDILNSSHDEITIIYDNEYSADISKCNFDVLVNTLDIVNQLFDRYYGILLRIYINKSGDYHEHSDFFFKDLTSVLNSDSIKSTENQDELFLYKPLSMKGIILDLPYLFTYKTYLDEKIVLNEYKCNDKFTLKKKIIAKAIQQYEQSFDNQKSIWDVDILKYTEDIIKRVMSLDLLWLYDDTDKNLDKCREEIEKIIVGYPEIYSYLDSCSENTQSEQLLIILHHAVKEITAFINRRCRFISEYVMSQEFSDHKKYVKGIMNGNRFKVLKTFSEGLNNENKEDPQSLLDEYYYTSGNELPQLLTSLQSYYESLKRVFKES